jgi:uncharacterized membrane protein YccC
MNDLLRIRPAPRRWSFAVRVAAGTAVLVSIGWAAGDVGAGLIATLGMFTADFGSRRPYLNRAVHAAVIAVALAAAVTIGVWSAQVAWIAVVAVSAVAVVAVWLCSGLAVGPPGAFVFTLACAAGVGVSASQRPAWEVGLLVLAGGAMAWMAVMSPALADVRGPEKAAVAAAGAAVAAYVEVAATAESVAARRAAATSLVFAWGVLIDYQPQAVRAGPELSRLRRANHALHVLFTDAMIAAGAGEPMPPGTAARARAIAALDEDPALVADRDGNRPPLRRRGTAAQLIRAVRPDSHTRRVMLRVAVAAPLAGLCAASLGLSHAYWAMAAAVLMLHQGDHRIATVQRGAARVLGTLAGLCVAALILLSRPTGLVLVAVLASLQFAIKMANVRNYALATVFTTATGLTIANRVRAVLDRVMTNIVSVTAFLARGESSSLSARSARRDLQESIFDLNAAEDAARKGSRRDRATAAELSRVVQATEQLGFATVAACWAAEQGNDRVFGSADADAYLDVLRALSPSTDTAGLRPIPAESPAFAASEIRDLQRALQGSR